MSKDPSDVGGPPKTVCEVSCLHCGEVYESYLIRWVDDESWDGAGYWACPTEGCSGKGFLIDILPTDENFCDDRGRRAFYRDDEDVNWDEIMPWPGCEEEVEAQLEELRLAGLLDADEEEEEAADEEVEDADELDDR